ncbi:AAA family ATPase [Paremcibacter congregatus]|uniref:AAA family ATPase n=1 Tax=Paremcibacter congregatus TaxID=2043170 RepID=UPI003A8D70E5
MDLAQINSISERIKQQVGKVIIGQDDALDLIIVCLISEGHILLEGVPGTAKTLLAKTIAATLQLDFGRVQFTPDLMPGDVLGTNLFNFQTNEFVLTKGPIFTQFLLADEINRTPPKTQAALLQAMNERAVTIESVTHDLGTGFMVVATQNPIEQQGTYPLPEAQLDRFLFKHILSYPSAAQEKSIVLKHGHKTGMAEATDFSVEPVGDLATLDEIRNYVQKIQLSEENVDYIVNIVRSTREHPSLQFGASPRSATMLARAARGYAALQGRDYVIPDDIKFLAVPTLRHRVILAPGADIEGLDTDQIILQIVDLTAAPR